MSGKNSFIVKQVLSLLLIFSLLVTPYASIITPVSANIDTEKVKLTIIGDVYTYEESVIISPGDTALKVLFKGVGESNVGFNEWGMVGSINGLVEKDTFFWSLYINECQADVGAGDYIVSPGDVIGFRYISWMSPPPPLEKCADPKDPEQESPTETNDDLQVQVQKIVDEVSEQILANGIELEWEAIALSKANKNVRDSYRATLFNEIKKKNGNLITIAEYNKKILAVRALGGDPQNVSGFDLIEKLYTHPQLKANVNGLAWSLIALDSDNYAVPSLIKLKQELVEELLSNKSNLEGWNWSGNRNASSDPDMTGMVLIALAPYATQAEVQKAIDEAAKWLVKDETIASYKSSPESISQVLMGLIATNKLDSIEIENKLITYLLVHYDQDAKKFKGFSEQPFQALVAYLLSLQNENSSIYDFRKIQKSVWDFPETGDSGSSPTLPGVDTGKTITLTIQGLNQQILFSRNGVNLFENDTAFSVLLRVLGDNVKYSGSGGRTYVEAIYGLAEFDHGPNSGWMFSVGDGHFPSYSAAIHKLHGGEHVRFLYTTNLGADVGNPSGGSKPQTPTGVGTEVQKSLEELTKASLPVDNRLPIHAVGQTVKVLNSNKKMNEQAARQLQNELAKNNVQVNKEINKLEQENIIGDEKEEVRLVIPAHALSSATQISVTEQNTGKRKEIVSSIYEFLPKGTKFEQPVYISIKVPLLIDDLDNLALAWLDEETNQWIPIPAVVDAENGIITGQVNHFTKFAVVDKTKATAYTDELHVKVQKAIQSISQSKWRSGEYNLWEILGLYHLGQFSAADYLKHIKQELVETKGEYRRVTDLSTAILGIYLAGENPERFAGINLVNKLYSDPNITRQGSNGIIFSLITLEMTGIKLPKDTLWTKDALIEWLLTNQHSNGSWSLAPNGEDSVDITAMALSSLSPYKERADVKTAVDKATAWLAKVQLEQGGFKYASQHPESSESIAQVIIGLTANQINPLVNPFAKEKGNPLTALFAYQMSSGQFEHTKGEGADYIATEQALMALLAYDLYVEKGISIFDMQQKKEEVVPKTKLPFVDQDLIASWALSAVEKAYEQQIMVGISAEQFAPKEWLTRAQFTTLLLRVLGEEPRSGGKVLFDDVPLNVWYADSVNHAREIGIINGTSPTTFHPNKPVTRQEMAIMLANAFQLKTKQGIQEFADLDEAWDVAQESIAAVYEHGIMVGVGNGQFAPREQVTREMAATAIVNMVEAN